MSETETSAPESVQQLEAETSAPESDQKEEGEG